MQATTMAAVSLVFGMTGGAAETNFHLVGISMAQGSPVVGRPTPEHQSAPKTFYLDGRNLQEIRRKVLENDPWVASAVAKIRRDAVKAMQQNLVSVTDKTFIAPSGDKHDYVSLSPYFWPDQATPKGLPYVLRDGETNPETKKYDSARLEKMCHNVEVLTQAYYLTGEEAYAAQAARQLRFWFLNPDTRMNPKLEYAQMVKGKNQGSRWGLIDTWRLIFVVDGVAMLEGSKSWTPSDTSAMQKWFADYLVWLRTSDLGKAEANANNNHGVYYDLQLADFALFTGQTNLAREVLAEAANRRIQTQIEPDGSMPMELERTKSLFYSLFNLNAFFTLARLGEIVDVDLYNYRTADGRSLRSALNWMAPYATGKKPWDHRQITRENFAAIVWVFRQAANAYHEPGYEKMIPKVKGAEDEILMNNLLQPSQSVICEVAEIDRARILKLAAAALVLQPPSVTDCVATNSPGRLHDYFSQADYAWPNPTSQNGLPYVMRDGESNPNNFMGHRLALRGMKDAVAALAAAYTITGEDKYVAKVSELLRIFFLDQKTRMNPNLQYAQAVLGQTSGTPYGIIDTLHLAELAVAIPFLETSPVFPAAVDNGMKQWFSDYTRWILTSTNGVKEMNSPNNHSIACWLQLASFAKLTGDSKVLAMAQDRFKTVLLPNQMAHDGSFPRELTRTKPYGYSIFQADNLAALCNLLSNTNEDFWRFTLPDGRTPQAAVDFIFPYLADKNKWLADDRGRDVRHWDSWPARQPCLILAFADSGNAKYLDLWKRLDAEPDDLEVRRNMAITQPLLWLSRPEQIHFFVDRRFVLSQSVATHQNAK